MEKLNYISMPFDLASLPEGWFSKYQINILYQLVEMTDGPILEIGPWVGRSTTVICQALLVQGGSRKFVTVDYGISSEEEWERRFGDNVRDKADPDRYLRHINQPEGNLTSLKRNLAERGFLDMVEVRRGDFHNETFDTQFSLIFCDATHSIEEIERNVPRLLELLAPGGILACDDISNERMIGALNSQASFEWSHLDHLLFYAKPKVPVAA